MLTSIKITNKNLSDDVTSRAAFRLIATCVPKDSDGDGIADQQDYDSDNDGILDLVEGQGQNFVAISNTDVNQDGIDDAYGTGVVPADTDSDTVFDYLDLNTKSKGGIEFWQLEKGENPTLKNTGFKIAMPRGTHIVKVIR